MIDFTFGNGTYSIQNQNYTFSSVAEIQEKEKEPTKPRTLTSSITQDTYDEEA